MRFGRSCSLLVFASLTVLPMARADEIVAVSRTHPTMAMPRAFGPSTGGDASQDGRYVVFTSVAPNLVPGQDRRQWRRRRLPL